MGMYQHNDTGVVCKFVGYTSDGSVGLRIGTHSHCLTKQYFNSYYTKFDVKCGDLLESENFIVKFYHFLGDNYESFLGQIMQCKSGGKIGSMNTPVKFEIAKLLKEKGFDLPCRLLYKSEKELEEGIGVDYDWNRFDSYSAPTIAEVVMWLYEKHGDWISVVKFETYSSCKFRHNCLFKEYNSPTEAYEAAIEYTLKNLI